MKVFFGFLSLTAIAGNVLFANTKSSTPPPKVEEGNPNAGFYFKATGAALLPSETGIGTFTDSWQYPTNGGIRSLSKPSKADYKFAGGFLIGYDAASLPNFAEVEYFHLSNSKHNYNDTSDGPLSFGSVFFNVGIPLTPGTAFVSDAYLKYQLNQVEGRLGHRFSLAKNRLEISPSIGIRWADLKHDLTFLVGNVRTSYWGVGPSFSIDGLYTLYKGLKLYSHFDAAVLIGNVEAHSLLNFFGMAKYESPNTNRVVPGLGSKLALRYDFTFYKKSSLRIEAGYQAAIYIGAFDVLTGLLETPPTQVQRIASITTNNFSFSGPYASIGFHM